MTKLVSMNQSVLELRKLSPKILDLYYTSGLSPRVFRKQCFNCQILDEEVGRVFWEFFIFIFWQYHLSCTCIIDLHIYCHFEPVAN